jgi:hypothetical protein
MAVPNSTVLGDQNFLPMSCNELATFFYNPFGCKYLGIEFESGNGCPNSTVLGGQGIEA